MALKVFLGCSRAFLKCPKLLRYDARIQCALASSIQHPPHRHIQQATFCSAQPPAASSIQSHPACSFLHPAASLQPDGPHYNPSGHTASLHPAVIKNAWIPKGTEVRGHTTTHRATLQPIGPCYRILSAHGMVIVRTLCLMSLRKKR